MKKRLFKKMTAYAAAGAMALSALPAAAVPVLADGEASAPDLNLKIVFQGSENYGGALDDSFKAVARTRDGGYVAVGYSWAASTDPAWGHVASTNNYAYSDGLVVKFNADMGVEWAQNFGGTGTDVLFDVDVLENGTIVAAGQSFLAEKVGNAVNASGWVLMIDPDDPSLFKEMFPGGSKGDYLQAVCAMEDNEFVVLGYSASTDAGDWENGTGTTCGLAISYDSEGEVNWAVANNIGGSAGLTDLKRSRFFGGCVDQNGDVIAVGDIQIGRSLYPSQIVKLDGMSGETVWSRIVGTDRTEDPTDLSENHTSCFTDVDTLTDGSYAVVGYSKGFDYLTEEALDAIGTQDSVIVRYGADGAFLNGEVVGTIDRTVDFTGITATSDGGYFAYGSADSEMIEGFQKERGYTFGNAGAHDFLLIKYDAENNCVWSESYGADAGDYINGMIITDGGHLVGVGESTSESGNPVYGNNGKNDATAFATFAFGSGEPMTEDSENVVWADGTFEDSANGYHGPITVSVTVENHAVSEVREVSQNETSSYYKRAKAVYDTIREANTWDVDSVSGATLSSNGIKKAVKRALSQAAAATVTSLIKDAAEPEFDELKASEARAAYEELGTYARSFVTNLELLGGTGSDEPALVGAAASYEEEADAPGAPYEHRTIGFEEEDVTAEEAEEDGFFDGEAEGAPSESAGAELSDTYYAFQKKYLDAVGLPTFWERGLSGRGVTLAVIDSGFTPAHQDINYENVLPATDCTSGTAVDGGMTDTNKHGTGVLGELIAIRDNGIGIAGLLDEVKIAPIKVNAKKNATADLEAAVYAAVDKYNASVITMSLGNTTFNTEGFREAIAYAASKNVLIIAAAGNDGKEDLVYPAAFDNVIGVGYVDSNFEIAEKSQRNESIDVTAPGVDIIMPYPSVRTHCTVSGGTSFAAPMVAAMAAAAKQMNPDITHDEFLALLEETSADHGEEGYDTAYGNGVVNFDAFAKKITFSDVLDPEAWYYDSVYWAYNKGVTSGYGEGTFRPYADLTRAQTVAFLYKMAGSPDTTGSEITFSDVKAGEWYEDAVKWAVANEITHGYGNGTFAPNAKCTRAMIVTFIANYAKNVAGTYAEPAEKSSFTDVKEGDWFKSSVDWAVANGITNGYGEGTFRPNVNCNRAMMAAFLRKAAAIGES